MGIFGKSKKDILIEQLQSQLNEANHLLSPEMSNIIKIKETIKTLANEANEKEAELNYKRITLKALDNEISSFKQQASALENHIAALRKQVSGLNDDLSFTDFGLYSPVYDFSNSEQYKNRLSVVRIKQKELIKSKRAATYPLNFALNGNAKAGAKMVEDNVKQILYTFNNECEVLIDKAKFNNVETIRNRIIKTYNTLNKLNSRMQISLTTEYLETKLDELSLAYEYQVKIEAEKEKAREERERLREERKVQKEIEEQRKVKKKEQSHYLNAYKALLALIEKDPANTDLLIKKTELESQLGEIEKSLEDIDYREANKRAGYVYIISNIGSFGENIFKIGMTRRLEPLDRISELSDASVPFNFDVHAIIFSDDAPTLENSLHRAFEDRKVNMINQRREFFRVTLDEIEQVVKENFDKTIEFTKVPAAEQYRETKKLLNIK